jgi:hypothetical protein
MGKKPVSNMDSHILKLEIRYTSRTFTSSFLPLPFPLGNLFIEINSPLK